MAYMILSYLGTKVRLARFGGVDQLIGYKYKYRYVIMIFSIPVANLIGR